VIFTRASTERVFFTKRIQMSEVFHLNKNVKITFGFKRSLVQNFNNGSVFFINSIFYHKINNCLVQKKSKELSKEEFDFLYTNKIANVFEKSQFIEPGKPEFNYPFMINSVVLEYNSKINYSHFLEALNYLNCKYILIIISEIIPVEKSYRLFIWLSRSTVQHCEIVLDKINNKFEIDRYKALGMKDKRIKNIRHAKLLTEDSSNPENVDYYRYKTIELSKKEIISKSIVNNSTNLYSESQFYNTYFFGKLFLKYDGSIKNSRELPKVSCIHEIKSYVDLQKVVRKTTFRKYWPVRKELIDVCKNCEFRHACIDKRIPLKRSNKEWYHKDECGYNPYIAKWNDETGYKNLKACGVTSDSSGFFIDMRKLEETQRKI
jgi:hypothetical protein